MVGALLLGLAVIVSAVTVAALGAPTRCLVPPVPGPVVGEYAPEGVYAGHWGVDLAAREGSAVIAPVVGEVTFSGDVVGTRAVTIRTEDGLRVSVSSLQSVAVGAGETVEPGDTIGRSGRHNGDWAVHLSLRGGEGYRDPEPFLGCAGPGEVRLIPVPD